MTTRIWNDERRRFEDVEIEWPKYGPDGRLRHSTAREGDGVSGGSLLDGQGRERRYAWTWGVPEELDGVSALVRAAADYGPSRQWVGNSHTWIFEGSRKRRKG